MGKPELPAKARLKQGNILSRWCTYGFFVLRRVRNLAFASSPKVTRVFLQVLSFATEIRKFSDDCMKGWITVLFI
jgi:hypothetical protein